MKIVKWIAVAGVGAAYIVSSAVTHRLAVLHSVLTEDAWPAGRVEDAPAQAAEPPVPAMGMRAAG